MRIYISIPINGHNPEERKAKAERFAKGIDAIGHIYDHPELTKAPKQ